MQDLLLYLVLIAVAAIGAYYLFIRPRQAKDVPVGQPVVGSVTPVAPAPAPAPAVEPPVAPIVTPPESGSLVPPPAPQGRPSAPVVKMPRKRPPKPRA